MEVLDPPDVAGRKSFPSRISTVFFGLRGVACLGMSLFGHREREILRKKTARIGEAVEAIRKIKLRAYRAFNRRGLRFILALFASLHASVRVRRLCKVSHKGDWVQRFPSGTLVEPRLTLLTLRQIEDLSRDLWMYQHRPAEGETVLDVGAGTGWETLVFSRHVGKSGRVVSIEAHPRVFSCLSKMCQANELENVVLIHAAITDLQCKVLISDSEDHLGHRIVRVDSGISVAGTTLDQVFRSLQLSLVDLLKMNIEGAERYALDGMREMIQKTKYVCISCHDFVADEGGPEEMRTKARVIAFLKQNDFDVVLRKSDTRLNVRDYVYGINRKVLVSARERRVEAKATQIGISTEEVTQSHRRLATASLGPVDPDDLRPE